MLWVFALIPKCQKIIIQNKLINHHTKNTTQRATHMYPQTTYFK